MIAVYDERGRFLGSYDTPSDVREDYPEAEIKNGKVTIKEPE